MSAQQNPGALFESLHRKVIPSFDGQTYDPKLDKARMVGQLAEVFRLMSDGEWWMLHDLAVRVAGSEAGISARIRDLRKPKFGGYEVERKRLGSGLWAYRLVL